MIIGIGTDIVRISRIRQFIGRNGDNGKSFILAAGEMNIADICSIAGRYAAKEAFLKALGIGFTKGLKRLTEIEISNDINGQPFIITYGLTDEIKRNKGIANIHLTISHDGMYAIAFVLVT